MEKLIVDMEKLIVDFVEFMALPFIVLFELMRGEKK